MRFSLVWLAFFTLIISECSCYTYWVDTTCTNADGPAGSEADWERFMQEAFSMATRAADRLESNSDSDFGAVYKRIFKIDKNDPTTFRNIYRDLKNDPVPPQTGKAFAIDMLRSIGRDWHGVTGGTEQQRLDSNVRIYCDNDRRWKPAKHIPGAFIDKSNAIGEMTTGPPCHIKPGLTAKVYSSTFKNTPNLPGQMERRHTITICDRAFLGPAAEGRVPIAVFAVSADVDLRDRSIELFKHITSKVILHEFTHLWPYTTSDVLVDIDPAAAYGWENIMKIESAENRVNNADNYGFLGLWALLADRTPPNSIGGHTLTRLIERSTRNSADEIAKAEASANEGKIAVYRNISRRWLNMMAKAFRA